MTIIVAPAPLPLDVLARKLTLGPPSVKVLLDIMDRSESVRMFLDLVREYLPEHEAEMMLLDTEERLALFTRLFDDRYFPLADFGIDDDDPYAYLVHVIPVQLGGMGYEDWHDFEAFREGHTLLLSLVEYPYIMMEEKSKIEARVPLLDAVTMTVGKEMVERMPPEGWTPKELHEACDDSPYEGAASFADWACGCTDTYVLDASYEEYSEEPWSREVVDALTEQWPKVQRISDKMFDMSAWLEGSPHVRFEELLDHIIGKLAQKVPKEQLPLKNGPKTLMEVFAEEEPEEPGCHVGRAFRLPGPEPEDVYLPARWERHLTE